MTRLAGALLALLLATAPAASQTNPRFNVRLTVDYSAAEETIRLLGDEFVDTRALAAMRGNRIAASTAGLIANRGAVVGLLADYLDSLRYHQIIRDDIYHLEAARRNLEPVRELQRELSRRNFSSRVISTVEQIFPSDAIVNIEIPMYVVALGHENVDAFVRRIVWHDDAPEFVGDGKGELTIVVNLSRAVDYGPTLDDRVVNLLGVVAHEVFHAAFGAFRDQSPEWQEYTRTHRSPFHALIDLVQNEGIAYYLSLEQHGLGYVPREWNVRSRESFATFSRRAAELLSRSLTQERAGAILREANLSGYWESFGSLTGTFIAREIDRQLGRAALIETIERGPLDMFRKYDLLSRRDTNLPELPAVLRDALEIR
jgi:hypothetical protein